MEILLLYNNKIAKELAEKLQEIGHSVILWEKEIQVGDLERMHPDRIISYTYRFIIQKEVIEGLKHPILNLHISYLPWNRGVSPNFWSFMEDTPKGVTIHEINEKIDAGRILLQKQLYFEEEHETFASTYKKLNKEIIKLFMQHSQELLDWGIEFGSRRKKVRGVEEWQADSGQKGSYHSKKQFHSFREKYPFSWEENIAEYKARINYKKMDFEVGSYG